MNVHLAHVPEPDWGVLGLGEQTSFFLLAVCIRCLPDAPLHAHHVDCTRIGHVNLPSCMVRLGRPLTHT